MLKFIFLDVDGVLNNELFYKSSEFKQVPYKNEEDWLEFKKSNICPLNVKCLNELTDSTGAQIVVSSSWRHGKRLGDFRSLFEAAGITGEVVGFTPSMQFLKATSTEVPRGCEIKNWLETSFTSEQLSEIKYVILDDDSDMLLEQEKNFVVVSGYTGLTPLHVIKAKYILGN